MHKTRSPRRSMIRAAGGEVHRAACGEVPRTAAAPAFAAALALGLLATSPATALAYTFTNVTDTNDPYANLFDSPTVSPSGTVLFHATRDAGGSGIFTGPNPVTNAKVTSDG